MGAELAIGHPTGPGSATFGLLFSGGPVLYVITQAWWYYTSTRQAWGARLLACLACAAVGVAAVGVAAVRLPPLVSVLVLDAILLVLVAALKRVHHRVLTTMTAGT
ncbi:hypothetical protein [Streptomyces sp. NPDC014685]|uniref:hypothetical protein n=1 Tax=Streptomyces sp. NPDC014685 TaxID=3364881 RepID=UPI0036F947DB